jgi:hypothetical protein
MRRGSVLVTLSGAKGAMIAMVPFDFAQGDKDGGPSNSPGGRLPVAR